MMTVGLSYATASSFSSTREQATLGLSADAARPVRFQGRLCRNIPMLRFALQALGRLIWDHGMTLDPIITVHPDRLIFEAFSGDRGAYGMLSVDLEMFELDGPLEYGTTNVDFTAWLWAALSELRSSRETTLRIGAEGFEVIEKLADSLDPAVDSNRASPCRSSGCVVLSRSRRPWLTPARACGCAPWTCWRP